MTAFQEQLRRTVLRLDGATGTEIQRYTLAEEDFRRGVFLDTAVPLKGNNECLNLTRPDVITAVHEAYIAAGADIIETNTFSANRISQKEYGLEAHAREMALAGARLARAAADKAGRKVWVAGSIGPTSKSLTLAPDIARPAERPYSFDGMAASYREQVEALIEGGVDLLLIETAFDALNVKAALYAVETVQEGFPVIVSVSVGDKSGRTLTGQTLEAFFTAVRHYPLAAFGVNCSLGADGLLPLVKEIASFSDVPVICYPNAGLPNELGGYDQTPAQMAAEMVRFDGLLNIAGGCCGTTPDHIRAIPALSPAPINTTCNELKVSGLEAYLIDTKKRNFTLIGERTNVAGSRKFARLVAAGDYDAALEVAANQIEGGADIIDINMDDAMLDGPVAMETFVRTLQNDPAVAKAALMIDSSHWECILAGLKNAQGKCIVNSISLKDGEEAFLAKAREIHRLGAAMVVMAFDEEGQATTYEKKITVCERAYRLLTGIGIPAEDIVFDVNVLSIGTGIPEHDRYGIDFIDAVRWIKQNLPGASTSGGISNLSFAFRGNNPVRSAMHAVFLYHAIRAGLDMAIVNPGMILQYDDIEPELRTAVEDLILCRDPHATERLMAVATDPHVGLRPPQDDKGNGQRPQDDKGIVITSGAEGRVEKSLETFLLTGREEGLAEAVNAARERLGSAVQVIEGPLMAGMEEVGRRFGEGKMFLPQVVKSAKVMKDAVALLEPYMEAGEQAAQRPVVIHATVKGDVHDIGKNIAGIVLRCNGFEVVDLGVMVDKETILEAAEKHHAALIGVSGLITPSLFQMEELCREMAARGLDTPLFIGGATTSALHTAVKLAPLYDHVFYAPDASAGAVLAKKCLRDRAAFEAAQHAEQARIRDLHEGRKAAPAPAQTGFEPESYLRTIPADIPLTEVPLTELVPLFDWSMFRAVWGVKENAELTAEGHAVLDRMVRTGGVSVRLAARFFAARRDGDTIDLGPCRLPMLRQEEAPGRSLADFVPAKGAGPFGLFAISVHTVQPALQQAQGPVGRQLLQPHPVGCTCEACRNDYDSMMERAVRVTLAEAASTWLDKRLAQDLPEGAKVAKPAAGYASCPDHSLKRDILGMLPEGLDISLTESCAMIPDAAICGFVVLHPEAGYPEIRHIGEQQYELYKSARGFSPDEARAFLSHLL
ncbi:MAG: methionine synthase [Bacteroidales bacterium]|nr:methionine synthase [Bacteroidales bacterium]